MFAEVAFDRHYVVCRRLREGSRRRRRQTKRSPQRAHQVEGPDRFAVLWHHRDRVVRTLRGAIETADASRRIDIDITAWVAKDGAGGTARQTFRIFAMHADLRREHVLRPFTANRHWSLNTYPAPQQTRLPVHFVAGKRAVAASDTKIHIHDQQVRAIDDAGRYLRFRGRHCAQVLDCFYRGRIVIGG